MKSPDSIDIQTQQTGASSAAPSAAPSSALSTAAPQPASQPSSALSTAAPQGDLPQGDLAQGAELSSKLQDLDKVEVSKSRVRRGLYIALGVFLTGLGVLGIWLPLVPTTIFLIGATWCFARSSPRLLAWLLRSKLLGPYLRVYTEKAGLSVGRKVSMICVLWTGILLAVALLPGKPLWVDILLLAIMLAVTVHIITIRPAAKSADSKG